MSEIYKSVITNLGLSLLANAQVTGTKVNMTHMALGDSNGSYYEPLPNATALRNERCRVPITSYYKSPKNETMLTIDAVVGADVPPAFTVREIALFDNQGNMITIGKVPATEKAEPSSGAATDLYFKVNIQLAHAANISITLDPLTSVATIGYVDAVVKVARDSTDALNGDFNTWLGEDYSPFKTDFTQHKEQNDSLTKHKAKQISLAPISGMTATNVQTAIEEVKLSANDIKTKWANVVGSPLVSTDTQAQLESKTQTLKDTLATNLTSKGQSSLGTEDLLALINKVPNINAGKRTKAGFVNTTGNGSFQQYRNSNATVSSRHITVSLDFKPSSIVIFGLGNNISSVTNYFSLSLGGTNEFIILAQPTDVNGVSYLLKNNVRDAYVNATGFRLPVAGSYTEFYYMAIE